MAGAKRPAFVPRLRSYSNAVRCYGRYATLLSLTLWAACQRRFGAVTGIAYLLSEMGVVRDRDTARRVDGKTRLSAGGDRRRRPVGASRTLGESRRIPKRHEPGLRRSAKQVCGGLGRGSQAVAQQRDSKHNCNLAELSVIWFLLCRKNPSAICRDGRPAGPAPLKSGGTRQRAGSWRAGGSAGSHRLSVVSEVIYPNKMRKSRNRKPTIEMAVGKNRNAGRGRGRGAEGSRDQGGKETPKVENRMGGGEIAECWGPNWQLSVALFRGSKRGGGVRDHGLRSPSANFTRGYQSPWRARKCCFLPCWSREARMPRCGSQQDSRGWARADAGTTG